MRRNTTPPRGVALLIVLVIISVTFALSYAIMRSQSTAVLIHHNANLTDSARQAALTGLTVALKKMHSAQWAGVGTNLTGSLGSYAGFSVAYTAGDSALSSGDADYSELPYRVTLLSTGHAVDPSDVSRVVTHQVRAVVRLLPRKVSTEPTDWATMQNYTVYQTKKEPVELDIPCQLRGKLRAQGMVKIARNYPNDDSAWWYYLYHLNKMRSSGYSDYRPIVGPVYLPLDEQDAWHLLGLVFALDVSVTHASVKEAASDWVKPTALASYRIYPGGPAYTIPPLGDTLENVTLEPNTASNPLGVFYRDGSIAIRANVTIRGSLICSDTVTIEGTGVRFEAANLPSLSGSSTPVRLPLVSCGNFTVKSGGGGSISGLVAVFEQFTIEKSPETAQFSLTGRLIARRLYIKERQPWETVDWDSCYDAFRAQLYGSSPVPFFPVWMKARGRDPKPLLTVGPDSTTFTYHWQNWSDPVYVPHPDDATDMDPNHPGLRWELVQWTDNP